MIWDVDSDQQLRQFQGKGSDIQSIYFSYANDQIYTFQVGYDNISSWNIVDDYNSYVVAEALQDIQQDYLDQLDKQKKEKSKFPIQKKPEEYSYYIK